MAAPIYLITGPMGAGKTTVSRLLAARFERGVHLEGDVFRRAIVAGRTTAYVRTNVVIDEELIVQAMKLWGLRTKREAIDFALRRLVGADDPWAGMLSLRGSGWEGPLNDPPDWES